MRPDLFAGSVPRDDSHRILARLANGGAIPVPGRQWPAWRNLQRSHAAAAGALLATVAVVWICLQDDRVATPAPPKMPATAAPPAFTEVAPQQAATIVNAAATPAAPVAANPSTSSRIGPAALPAPRTSRPRMAKPAVAPRGQHAPAAVENDDDVTLLAAMLKHANPQKPSPTQPKE